jgi:hypothetical protein
MVADGKKWNGWGLTDAAQIEELTPAKGGKRWLKS